MTNSFLVDFKTMEKTLPTEEEIALLPKKIRDYIDVLERRIGMDTAEIRILTCVVDAAYPFSTALVTNEPEPYQDQLIKALEEWHDWIED